MNDWHRTKDHVDLLGCIFQKKGFCLLAPFLMNSFFQNSGHYIGCDNHTQIRSRIDPVQTKEKWQTIFSKDHSIIHNMKNKVYVQFCIFSLFGVHSTMVHKQVLLFNWFTGLVIIGEGFNKSELLLFSKLKLFDQSDLSIMSYFFCYLSN